ncbi:alpha/beta fold hydrolase [Amnibacterium sp. CER49]|uniref:alpha/beta fold hydrolase n=1 Tax=Amnibacterium sp. CER49 TaxID=3039161 RepID=UPI00244C9CFA|nr:alpha/beta fold hydrolase [Amnibacterium sp. CER49]MDH2443400.1 alpha/beta fold hydrolase [Amnibacterium sp. CER49]
MAVLPQRAPEPRFVLASDGVRLATYDEGDAEAPAVLAVHGFASSAAANWWATGWARDLVRAGHRVLALDQRGHGASSTPRDAGAYSMDQLVDDVRTVLDTYLLDGIDYIGYSLGARVGWQVAVRLPHLVGRAMLGGIPDGDALASFRGDEALAFARGGPPVEHPLTRAYIEMAAGIPGNDLEALIALVDGLHDAPRPDPADPPRQPVLFATGSDDPILPASQRLAAATPGSDFFVIPGRNHFNAPPSRPFRDRAIAFLADG